MPNKPIELPELSQSDIARFWAKVDRSPGQGPHGDCWEWTGNPNPKGYGQFRIGKATRRAHRVAYAIAHGYAVSGICVLHTCDNPACVNPKHLWLGTDADNIRDRDRKGRGASGERSGASTHPERVVKGECHGMARLNERQVLNIRDRCAKKTDTQAVIARECGISLSMVERIVARKNWKHI